jgi:hypothetical protein
MKNSNGTFKSERHFLDFVINGESLWEKLGKSRDLVSILCREFALTETSRAVDRLLLNGDSDHPQDRRSLFVCGECGDLGCGAITLVVVKDGDAIVWKDFGFENNYDDNIELNEFKDVGPFMFDATLYEAALHQAIALLQ